MAIRISHYYRSLLSEVNAHLCSHSQVTDEFGQSRLAVSPPPISFCHPPYQLSLASQPRVQILTSTLSSLDPFNYRTNL